MGKKILACLVMIVAGDVLVGCSSIESGVVRGKRHIPADTDMMFMHMGNGTLMPIFEDKPEKFLFDIYGVNENGTHEAVWIEVTKEEYKKYNLGDIYPENILKEKESKDSDASAK